MDDPQGGCEVDWQRGDQPPVPHRRRRESEAQVPDRSGAWDPMLVDDLAGGVRGIRKLALLSKFSAYLTYIQGKEREWAGYLLPQGYSTALGARASQQIDFDWGNSIYHVTDIMGQPCSVQAVRWQVDLVRWAGHVCHPKGKRVSLTSYSL